MKQPGIDRFLYIIFVCHRICSEITPSSGMTRQTNDGFTHSNKQHKQQQTVTKLTNSTNSNKQ